MQAASPLRTQAELEAAIDALYAGPLEDFVAARNDLVKRLRTAGDRDAATRVKALPKPSVSAWGMNQLWWHEREAFTALLDAGESVRAVQLGGAGPAQQTAAAKQRRACVDRLLAAAQVRLESAGHNAGSSTLRRIATSLDAAAAHGRRLVESAPGRLAGDLDPPGFDTLDADVRPATPWRRRAAAAAQPDASSPEHRDATNARATLLAQAHARVGEAARNVDDATRALDDAKARAQAAADALATARARAHAAQREEAQAELAFARAKKEADALAATAGQAHEELREATGLLARAQTS